MTIDLITDSLFTSSQNTDKQVIPSLAGNSLDGYLQQKLETAG